jgi:hypothetical protein
MKEVADAVQNGIRHLIIFKPLVLPCYRPAFIKGEWSSSKTSQIVECTTNFSFLRNRHFWSYKWGAPHPPM